MTSDADGNTLTDTSGRTMTWDSQNRMASCTKGGVTSSFTYGADGLRRSSTVNNITTLYAYDGQTLIREMKKNAQTGALYPTATYLQGVSGGECRVDETQVTENYTNPLTNNSGVRGVTSWYIYDGLGSVEDEFRTTNAGSGAPPYVLTASPKYDVYGLARAGGTGASSRQGFVGSLGHVSDTETGLIYMKARYYDPSVGRFVSQDPDLHGGNWFAYCDNNPVNEVDANGKSPVAIGILLLAVFAIVYCSVNIFFSDFIPPAYKDIMDGINDYLAAGAFAALCVGAVTAGAPLGAVCLLGGAALLLALGGATLFVRGLNELGTSSASSVTAPAVAAIYGEQLTISLLSDSIGVDT